MKTIRLILCLFICLLFITSCGKSKTYNVRFFNDEIQTDVTYNKNDSVKFETPTKEGYTFAGWLDEAGNVVTSFKVTGDVTFKASWTINSYTYKFVNDDNSVLKEAKGDYNTLPIEPTDIPAKQNSEAQSFTFKGWDKELAPLTSDVTYIATYTSEDLTFTYKFLNGQKVVKEVTGKYGDEIVYPTTSITKSATAEFNYEFSGWDQDAKTLTADIVFNAVFNETKRSYKVKFTDDTGKTISEATLEYGATPVAPTNVDKAPTAQYTYTFTGWNAEITPVTKAVTYKAVYNKEVNKYTYKFLSKDGATLKEETVDYGTLIVAPTAPEVEGFRFSGWDKEVGNITSDITFNPLYKEAKLTSLEGLKISFLGDSITTFYKEGSPINTYYGSNEGTYYYPKYCPSVDTVEKTWWMQLINNNKMVLGINNAWSGSTAYGTGASCGMTDARCNTLVENGNPDIVIVYLGTNDSASIYEDTYTLEHYELALNTIVEKINALCDADIFFVTLSGKHTYKEGKYLPRAQIFNGIIEKVANAKGCGLIPIDDYIDDKNDVIYLNDNLHWNYKGTTLLAKVCEKYIKEFYGIEFTETIELEYPEVLPEGVRGYVTATADSGFWTGENYKENVYLSPAEGCTNPTFSIRVQIVKQNDKYYISNIAKDGADGVKYKCDYVLYVSSAHNEYNSIKSIMSSFVVGDIVSFDENMAFPMKVTVYEGDGTYVPDEEEGGGSSYDPELIKDKLHVTKYNSSIWAGEDVCVYQKDALGIGGNTYVNFYCICLHYDSATSSYVITALNPSGKSLVEVTADFEYVILIYNSLSDKSYYDLATVGKAITIVGELTSGDCYIGF